MKQKLIAVVTLTIGAFLLLGCQESESDIIKRAKLVGNENIQLKQQLAEKDKEIQALKDEMAQKEADFAKKEQEFGDATIKTLQMVLESEKRNETLMTEIETLKEQLKK